MMQPCSVCGVWTGDPDGICMICGAPTRAEREKARRVAALRQERERKGVCLECGRVLTDPDSIARMIGPECWKKPAVAVRYAQ